MRQILAILMTAGLTNTAFGHTLDSEHNLLETLWHQIFGIHHLPLTVGLVFVSVVLLAVIGRRMARQLRK